MAKSIKVLVTGATGKQGGAVARLLLGKGHEVRALTRKLDSPAAKALEKQGAKLAQGNFDDPASLRRAIEGSETVFAMSTPFEAGMEAETRQGKALADAAKAAGVKHFVFTSVAGADRKSGIPHFDSKYQVELYLKQLGLPHTVIAPVYFMDNIHAPFSGLDLAAGKLVQPMPPSRKLQQIAVEDIGAFGALVVERREQLLGKRIDIAGDDLTGPQVAEVVSRLSGRKIEYQELPLAVIEKQNEDFGRMFRWFQEVGYSADLAGLRRDFPEVGWHTFEQWAKGQDWKAKQ